MILLPLLQLTGQYAKRQHAPLSIVVVGLQCHVLVFCVATSSIFRTENGCIIYLRNTCSCLQVQTALQPRDKNWHLQGCQGLFFRIRWTWVPGPTFLRLFTGFIIPSKQILSQCLKTGYVHFLLHPVHFTVTQCNHSTLTHAVGEVLLNKQR